MTALEIGLLIGGVVVFALSFIIPVKEKEASKEIEDMIEDAVKKKVSEEVESIRTHVDDVVDEAVEYAQEKTERSLERISNEKIMAVNEYSDTVLEEINKNHKEVMFLYDMLNDKHANLMDVLSEANQAVEEAKQSTKEVNEAVNAVKESAKDINSSEDKKDAQNTTHKVSDSENIEKVQFDSKKTESKGLEDESQNNKKIVDVTSAFADYEEFDNSVAEENISEFEAIRMPVANIPKTNQTGKVRTLKWAEFATKQADEMLGEGTVNDEIISLHEQGKSDVEIARDLNMGVGEVSLIIGIHGNKGADNE